MHNETGVAEDDRRGEDPPVGLFLTWFTAASVGVVAGSSIALFVLPGVGEDLWPWELTPFNTRFLGALYLGVCFLLGAPVVTRQWSSARLVLWISVVFAVVVLVVSVVERDRFLFDDRSLVVIAWFVAYVVVPVNAAVHLWRFRPWPRLPPPASAVWRAVLATEAALVTVYGLALLAVPDDATGFWPWPIDAFHARVYSAVFFALATGAALLVRAGRRVDWVTLGLTQGVFGAAAIAGLALVDRTTSRIAYGRSGTILWLVGFGALAVVGALMALRPPAERPVP